MEESKLQAVMAINDMLLMSFEKFLRFFPVWPVDDDASFTNLRAAGAFLVGVESKVGLLGTSTF